MRKYIFLAVGAFFGAILRYLLKEIELFNSIGDFPINTFSINILGSFILAFIITFSFKVLGDFALDIKRVITIGFLGAFTTFSTFCKEAVMLLNNRQYVIAFFYMTTSLLMGILVSYLGFLLAYKAKTKFSKS